MFNSKRLLPAPALLMLGLLVASPSISQTVKQVAKPADLEVLKFKWSKERIGWERDPFAGPVESYDEMRVRMRNERRIQEAKKNGSALEVDKITREAKADDANIERIRDKPPPRYVFAYKITVKNTSSRTIKLLDWDYVFFEPGTEHEIGRHEFTSEETIAPGSSKELNVLIRTPPTKTISAYALAKGEERSVQGHVVVARIEYSDGSVWPER